MTRSDDQPRRGIEDRLRRTLTVVADRYEHDTGADVIDLRPPSVPLAPARPRRRAAAAALAAAVLAVLGTVALADRTDTVVDSASRSTSTGLDRETQTSRSSTTVPDQDPSLWAPDVMATPPAGYTESTNHSQSIVDPVGRWEGPEWEGPEAEVGFADLVYPHAKVTRSWRNGSDVFEAFTVRTTLEFEILVTLPGAVVYEVARPERPVPAVLFTEDDMVHIVWYEGPTVLAGLRATGLEPSQLLELAPHVRVTR